MLGEELKKARLDAGLSQEELATRAQIHRTYVSLLELNKKSPTMDVLFRLCDALGLPASDLIGRVERSRQANRSAH
jgi:transcriptional regulator with XRE-family HTH domain